MYNFLRLKKNLEKIKERFQEEIVSLRTGRATPDLVNKIMVDCYGSNDLLEHLASIVVEDAKTIRIQPWDKSTVLSIEQGIERSNLGLRPVIDKESLRISLPELTSERRKDLLKILKDKLEDAKIAARKTRDEIWSDIQSKEREGDITEDEKFRLKDEMQKIVDDANGELGRIAEKKEKEIIQ